MSGLGRLSAGGLKGVFVGIRGVRDIIIGEDYDYEPWISAHPEQAGDEHDP